jgi:aspartyl protease family protein
MIESYASEEAAITSRLLSCVAAASALGFAIYFGWSVGGPAGDPRVELASSAPAPGGPRTVVIKTDRRGSHHVMRAVITGPSGRSEGVSFLVDTGASELVLPSSIMKRLGFEAADLPSTQLQTANGRVPARQGVLKSIELGGPDSREIVERVSAVFIDDALIGGVALMGMSVLGRYRVTIEDNEDRIVLVRQR